MSAARSHRSPATCTAAARVYRRRRPERTALYRLVQQHLETWLARTRERDPDAAPIPRHVERELRGFLECGILACGFARARCGACGHDFLVAFSCKGRGICPSCTTRRMAETAAHLVEHVFPQVPVPSGWSPSPSDCATSCTTTRCCSAVSGAAYCGRSSRPGRCPPARPSSRSLHSNCSTGSPPWFRHRASISWARLLARIYEIQPLSCPRCQGPLRLIAFLTEPASIRALLAHLGEPTAAPPLAPRARAPPDPETAWAGTPAFAFDQSPPWNPITPAPDPGYTVDQTLD